MKLKQLTPATPGLIILWDLNSIMKSHHGDKFKDFKKKLAALSMLHKAKKAYYACDVIRFLVP